MNCAEEKRILVNEVQRLQAENTELRVIILRAIETLSALTQSPKP